MLRIVAWDDPRCVEPLIAAGDWWRAQKGETIEITRRPLTAFNDQPLIELSEQCDVMIIDYPHIPQAVAEGAITPICDLLDPRGLAPFVEGAIGAAQVSFVVDGHSMALASDAACQIAAYRPEVLSALGFRVPKTWQDVIDLASAHPGSVALPLYHTDAISCILSLTAGEDAGPDGGMRLFPRPDAALSAIKRLAEIVALVDPVCWSTTPPLLYAEANKAQCIAYVPLTFGYTRLTRDEEGGGWRFAPPPEGCGSLLGGAGMAVSSKSPEPLRAAAFAAWYCSDDGQILAAKNGGQPASNAAWRDVNSDSAVGHFFSDTITTQETAYVRPRAIWWPDFQTEAGKLLVRMLRGGDAAVAIFTALEALYAEKRPSS